jgi:hypothetical protein
LALRRRKHNNTIRPLLDVVLDMFVDIFGLIIFEIAQLVDPEAVKYAIIEFDADIPDDTPLAHV